MGHPTKVQLIKRKKSEQWYINFPAALAHAMEFVRGEVCEWFVEDKAHLLLERTAAPGPRSKKKTPDSLLHQFHRLWNQCRDAFDQDRSWRRAEGLLLSQLVCLGRHTVTGLMCTQGRQLNDWSADYRFFSQERFSTEKIFAVVRRTILSALSSDAPLIVAMDDSLLRKSGTHIWGSGFRRDPLSPPFHTNLVRGQRVLQLSAALPGQSPETPARMIPIDFVHAPTAIKPKKNAPPEAWDAYRQLQKQCNISRQGAHRLKALRAAVTADEHHSRRPLWGLADGRFTNRTVLKDLPDRVTFIGRIRADAKLYHPPCPSPLPAKGRKRRYGLEAPTPLELRQDESVPWQTVRVFAAGQFHEVKVKTLSPVLWRAAGYDRPVRLVVIAPLAYRLRKGSRLLYRKPAYLICTDPDADLTAIVQAYVWRWDIEVNFRDEKQLIGLGEAQVRTPAAVQTLSAFAVIAYALLLLAAALTFGPNGLPQDLPTPKWRRRIVRHRASTAQLMNQLRYELWSQTLAPAHFSPFMNKEDADMKSKKFRPVLAAAVCYATV